MRKSEFPSCTIFSYSAAVLQLPGGITLRNWNFWKKLETFSRKLTTEVFDFFTYFNRIFYKPHLKTPARSFSKFLIREIWSFIPLNTTAVIYLILKMSILFFYYRMRNVWIGLKWGGYWVASIFDVAPIFAPFRPQMERDFSTAWFYLFAPVSRPAFYLVKFRKGNYFIVYVELDQFNRFCFLYYVFFSFNLLFSDYKTDRSKINLFYIITYETLYEVFLREGL